MPTANESALRCCSSGTLSFDFLVSMHVHVAPAAGRTVLDIRSSAKTATTAPMPAAPTNPREKASAAPLAVVRLPAVLATAERTATPRAAPISCPVIRNPEATPAWEDGMPAIEVTDTGTKTMPMPSPRAKSQGRMSLA